MTDDDSTYYESEEQALADVLPNLEAGKWLSIHDPECGVDDGCACTCDAIFVRGPSGKA